MKRQKLTAAILEQCYWDVAKQNFDHVPGNLFKERLNEAHPAFRHITIQELVENECAIRSGEYRPIRSNGRPSAPCPYYSFPTKCPNRAMFERLEILINRKKKKYSKNNRVEKPIADIIVPVNPQTEIISTFEETNSEDVISNFVDYLKKLGIKKFSIEF